MKTTESWSGLERPRPLHRQHPSRYPHQQPTTSRPHSLTPRPISLRKSSPPAAPSRANASTSPSCLPTSKTRPSSFGTSTRKMPRNFSILLAEIRKSTPSIKLWNRHERDMVKWWQQWVRQVSGSLAWCMSWSIPSAPRAGWCSKVPRCRMARPHPTCQWCICLVLLC